MMRMKKLVFVAVVVLTASLTVFVKAGEYKSITPLELKEILKNKDFFLLDVHVPEQAHIPGTDAFIDYRKIRQNINMLPADKNTKIVVYCLGGGMSRVAASVLADAGYTRVFDLTGGTNLFNRLPHSSPRPD